MTTTSWAPAGTDDAALLHASSFHEASLRSVLSSLSAQTTPGSPAAEAVSTASVLLEALTPEARREAVRHPLYQIWRTRLLQLVTEGEREPVESWCAHLPRLFLAPLLGGGDALPPVRVSITAGRLRLPGLPRHLLVKEQDGAAVLRAEGAELVVEQADRRNRYPVAGLLSGGPGTVEHHRLAGTATILDSADPWIGESIARHNRASASPRYPARDVEPAHVTEAVRDAFDDAAALIARSWPACHAELASHVRLVVPFTSELMAGWTPVNQLGAIYVRAATQPVRVAADSTAALPPADYTAERLVHESAHTRLNVLSLHEPLFVAKGQHELLPSPLRKDLRPAAGVYHAAFVLSRVVAFMRRAAALTGAGHYAERADQCRRDLHAAAESLRRTVALSAYGRSLLEQACAGAEETAAEPESTRAGRS
ncbi:aKG-HExxH-type peptide beta-hydroxylase [Nonomuraea sp. NPDC004297]